MKYMLTVSLSIGLIGVACSDNSVAEVESLLPELESDVQVVDDVVSVELTNSQRLNLELDVMDINGIASELFDSVDEVEILRARVADDPGVLKSLRFAHPENAGISIEAIIGLNRESEEYLFGLIDSEGDEAFVLQNIGERTFVVVYWPEGDLDSEAEAMDLRSLESLVRVS